MVISNESNEHAPEPKKKANGTLVASKAKKPAKRKRGRPSIYNDELGEKICMKVGQGMTLLAIENETGIPRSTIVGWAVDQSHPFSERYARAREIRAELMMDELEQIADDEAEDCQRSRLRVDTRKWILAKMRPRVYGEHNSGVSITNTVVNQTIHRAEEEQDAFLERKERIRQRMGIEA